MQLFEEWKKHVKYVNFATIRILKLTDFLIESLPDWITSNSNNCTSLEFKGRTNSYCSIFSQVCILQNFTI